MFLPVGSSCNQLICGNITITKSIMPYTVTAPKSKKSAYRRPYKSRRERREVDRRKHDESKDSKFLFRVALGIGLVLLVAWAFVLKGTMD